MPNVKPYAPNCLKLTMQQHIGADTLCQNHVYYSFSGQADVASLEQFATAMNIAWGNHVVSMVNGNNTLTSATALDLSSVNGNQAASLSNQVGTYPGTDFLSAQSCIMLFAPVGRRYRGGKPRVYISGMSHAMLQGLQDFTTTYVGQAEAAWNTFVQTPHNQLYGNMTVLNNINVSYVHGHTWTQITLPSGQINYRRDPVYRDSAVTDILSSWVGNQRICSQRRRTIVG